MNDELVMKLYGKLQGITYLRRRREKLEKLAGEYLISEAEYIAIEEMLNEFDIRREKKCEMLRDLEKICKGVLKL
jgi:hypothetical protein